MRARVVGTVVALLLSVSLGASARLPATFVIDQVFSDASGDVQFLLILDRGNFDCDSGEGRWAGETLVSAGPGPLRTFTFPSDLPNCRTSGRRILIATQGFADLGLIPPDYVMPRGFVQFPDGILTFANVTQLRYSGLPNDGVHAIDGSGRRVGAYAENFAGQFAVVGPLSPRATVDVVEYYNAALDHYFITWVAAEVAALDAGTQIRGWTRTGAQFKAHATAQPGTSPICRFYIPPALGDSHFFGRGTVECESTGRSNPSFVLESSDFMRFALPESGACAAGLVPVYRVFSNRPDANHRYMTDRALRDQMVARNWLAEGDGPDLVVMCAPQ